MSIRRLVTLFSFLLLPSLAVSQSAAPYQAPRTEYGAPDFQGVWATHFVTMMERPDNVASLVLPPEAAHQMARGIQANFSAGVTDPDFAWAGEMELARVRGDYRSSIIVHPANGRIPWLEEGLTRALEEGRLINEGLDGPEHRPLEERCLASLGFPPVRALPILLPRFIAQTRDHLVFFTEDAAGLRLIRLNASMPATAQRSFSGYSVGEWEEESLVVRTAFFRGDYPARINIPVPIMLGEQAEIVERFTRYSEDELNYQFTVTDPEFYSEPWSGEFSFYRLDGITYEYACHEGNYSLPGALRGGIVQALER